MARYQERYYADTAITIKFCADFLQNDTYQNNFKGRIRKHLLSYIHKSVLNLINIPFCEMIHALRCRKSFANI